MHKIVIVGKPIPWKRPAQTKSGRRYDSQKRDKDAARWIMKSQYKGKPIDGAVKLTIYFIMQIPDSWSVKKKNAANGEYHKIKPDLDNLEKFYKDCMSGIVYRDDAQVALVVKSKKYGANTRTEILIEEF